MRAGRQSRGLRQREVGLRRSAWRWRRVTTRRARAAISASTKKSEQRRLAAIGRDAEVIVGQPRGHAAALRAIEKTDLDEKRFVNLFDGVGLFGQCCGQSVQANRAALIFVDDGEQQLAINLV